MKLHQNPINVTDPFDPSDLPVYVMTEGLELPEKGSYYLITGDGVWLRKDTGLLYAMFRVNGIGVVPKLTPTVGLRIPQTPEAIMFQALYFCRYIYKQHQSECVLLLVYVPDTEQYGFICPKQRVTRSTIKYDADDFRLTEEQVIVGTFHSHCNFSAFHSATDHRDEAGQDGLHVTIGNVDDNQFTVAASLVVNGMRATVEPMKYLGGLEAVEPVYTGIFHAGNHSSKRYRLNMTLDEIRAHLRTYKGLIKRWSQKVTPESKSFFGWMGGTTYVSPKSSSPSTSPLSQAPPICPSTTAGSSTANGSGSGSVEGVNKSWNAIGVPAQREAPRDVMKAYHPPVQREEPPTSGPPVQREQVHRSRIDVDDNLFAGLYDDDTEPPNLDQNDLMRKFHERNHDGCD